MRDCSINLEERVIKKFIPRFGIPILLYHKIIDLSDSNPRFLTYVSPEEFEHQMDYLYSKGYTTISLDRLIEHFCEKIPLPQKPIIITFDDGFKDNYTNAFPILKRYGFTATIFLVSNYIGETNQWDKVFNELLFPLLSRQEIKEMAEYGISFGSHTCTHPDMRKLSRKELEQEVKNSKIAIEEIVGRPVTSFCYPFGLFNAEVKQVIKEAGYKCACSIREGPLRVSNDLFALRRIPIFPHNNGWMFKFKLSNWYFWLTAYKKFKIGPRLRKIILGKDEMDMLMPKIATKK